ncbi:hypothetical protein AN644_02995 [Candidatus Epulonipiscium fishelsonii]|nr:hypothetical protein AN644_02995 [Epulopiscium sp. SCG-C06WGA-EpuloA1]
MRKAILLLMCMIFILTGCTPQNIYPSRDITVIIPFPAGGGTDVSGRAFLNELNKQFPNINIVVTNINGASGTIGANELYNSKADGYTLMVAGSALNIAYEMGIFDKTFENYQPVSRYLTSELGLYVNANSPYQTYEEFINAAKSDPESIIMGVSSGTLNHFATLAIEDQNDIKFKNAVNTTNALVTDLMSERVQAYVGAVSQNSAYIKSGDFRCLGVYKENRHSDMPDVPTFEELGIDMDFTQMFGIWAPIGTPPEIIETLDDAIKVVCESQSYIETVTTLGYTSSYLDTQEYKITLAQSLEDINVLGETLNDGSSENSLLSGTYTVPTGVAIFVGVLLLLKLILKIVNKEKLEVKFLSLYQGKSTVFLAGLLAYLISMEILGYMVSTILFLIGMTWYLEKSTTNVMNKKIFIRIILTSVSFAVITYIFFVYVAQIIIPVNFLGF